MLYTKYPVFLLLKQRSTEWSVKRSEFRAKRTKPGWRSQESEPNGTDVQKEMVLTISFWTERKILTAEQSCVVNDCYEEGDS